MTLPQNRLFPRFILLAALFSGFVAVSCDDDNSGAEEPIELEADTVRNMVADPALTDNHFALYSFDEKSQISNSDSATARWDIGIRSTSVIFNSGVSGPGTTSVQLVDGVFEELMVAPVNGYRQDAEGNLAVPGGSNNGWYTYTGEPNHAILPIPGKVFMIKTGQGNYVKMEILSYYKDNPPAESITMMTPGGRQYTFRFLLQPDGTNEFE